MTLASILIRTKNEGATLGRVLEAVHAQTERDFEVVLVDSGSTDNTVEIAESYGAHIVRIPPESFTYGYALNVGMEHCRGEFVAILSGHAVPCNEVWLASLLAEFADPLVAGTSSVQIPEHPYYASLSRTVYQFIYRTTIPYNGMLCCYLFHNASSAIRASVWQEVPFNPYIKACEDHEWALKVRKLGYKLTHCPYSCVIHSHALSPIPRLQRALRETMAVTRIHLQLSLDGHTDNKGWTRR